MTQINNYVHLFKRKLLGAGDIVAQKVAYARFGGSGKKILLNSFPKSGTHLLSQVISAYPSVLSFNRFSTHASSFRFEEKFFDEIIRTFDVSVSNELVKGHLRHSNQLEESLIKNDFLTFFLYRDPRDIIASEAHYLRSMNPWHKLHRFFSKTKSIQEAIDMSFYGIDNSIVSGYPDFGSRFDPFLGWLDADNCVCIRFEDLVGEKSQVMKTLKHIAIRLNSHFGNDFDSYKMAKILFEAIDPSSSHTYRPDGGVGKWKSVFTEEQEKNFAESFGYLLEKLGY